MPAYITSQIYMSHVAHMGSFERVAWLIHICDMTHPYMRHDSSIFATWLTAHCYNRPHQNACISHVTDIHESCRTYGFVRMGSMTHVYIFVTLLFHVCDITHFYSIGRTKIPKWVMNELCNPCEWVMSHKWMSHVTHVNEPCHAYECAMSHIWMSHVTHMNTSWHETYKWITSHIWMSHVIHMKESCHTYGWDMSHVW